MVQLGQLESRLSPDDAASQAPFQYFMHLSFEFSDMQPWLCATTQDF